ncbi:hypothetical protein TNCV_151761 [Trichonephila clavipes]|uniref:Uncharacterized protein n=1 Tax=Trichonephila clavipes TaxID=2585209 RepID=A0A8X6RFX5_TRICX|nr:hypothetical protein TNCV_151761 [Trichonephila clavipes]
MRQANQQLYYIFTKTGSREQLDETEITQSELFPFHQVVVKLSLAFLLWKKLKQGVLRKSPEGSELANMVSNDVNVAKLAANLVTKNDANLALPPRFRQVLIESPL